jgi:hypothetical protein
MIFQQAHVASQSEDYPLLQLRKLKIKGKQWPVPNPAVGERESEDKLKPKHLES